ncbi:uncharacterized protein PV09_09393 [Verruconis gallopava]|uniref:Uncharacterized protein n=1 Tax=Verruconis gallopava TaxID=253628 RepID=A0A0D1ZWJ6_9PEZI|nr:uncharacterized protein PV09_09393 [Verruconis gallopava]KIV98867.1 hypothetical protein PV09_09393 [Verruconis gallopava]
MAHDTITPAELLELARESPIRSLEALQQTLPLRQEPGKWNSVDQSSYPPIGHENGTEGVNGTQSSTRKRRGRPAKKPTPQPPEEALSPLSNEEESTKRIRLSSPIEEVSNPNPGDQPSPKPFTSDNTLILFQAGLVNEVVSSTQNFTRLWRQIRDIHQELTDVLQTLSEPLQRLQDMQKDVQKIQKVQSEVQRIMTFLHGS